MSPILWYLARIGILQIFERQTTPDPDRKPYKPKNKKEEELLKPIIQERKKIIEVDKIESAKKLDERMAKSDADLDGEELWG